MSAFKSSSLLFFIPTAMSAIFTLISIPLLIATIGADVWAEIALGQSVGAFATVIISFGWVVTGPAMLARMTRNEQRLEFSSSLFIRLCLSILVLTIGASLLPLFDSDDTLLVIAAFVGASLIGLESSWYFISLSKPLGLIFYVTTPRIAASAIGLLLVLSGSPAVVFPLSQAMGSITGALIALAVIVGRDWAHHLQSFTLSGLGNSLRRQKGGVGANVLLSLLYNSPLPIISVAAPEIMSTFAIADKLVKQAITALAPARNIVLAWAARRYAKVENVATFNPNFVFTVIAGISGVAFIGAGVLAGPILVMFSAGTIALNWALSFALSGTVAAGFFARVLPGALLAPINRLNWAVVASGIGLVATIPLLLWLSQFGQTTGALCAITIGLLIVVLIERIAAQKAINA